MTFNNEYKYVNGNNFWIVKRNVLNIIQNSRYSIMLHVGFGDNLHSFA
jgi:hypothetical protein